jgi:putative addiction module killer protein
MSPYRVVEYVEEGKSPFSKWFNSLDASIAAKVDRYIRRLENGNFSSVKSIRQGVFESRIKAGPGYRIYFGRDGLELIVLLAGGSKRSQKRDIEKALMRWAKYKKEK